MLDFFCPPFDYVYPVTNYIISSLKLRRAKVAEQITGVVITINPDGTTYNLQAGPNGWQGLSISSLFDRTIFDENHLFGNIRLRKIIGNFGELWSQEFTNSINQNGIRTTSGDFFNVGFVQNADGSYTLSFGSVLGGSPNQSITVDPRDLIEDTHDLEMVRKNVGAFIRIAGFTDLTTPAANGLFVGKTAIQAVALQTFRF